MPPTQGCSAAASAADAAAVVVAASHSHSAVGRTATDALLAKYSAVVTAGYPVLVVVDKPLPPPPPPSTAAAAARTKDGWHDAATPVSAVKNYSATAATSEQQIFPAPDSGGGNTDDGGGDNASYTVQLQRMAEYVWGCRTNNNNNNITSQTPLLNVGYAVRVACILHHVQTFVAFHEDKCDTIQMVVLGAGFDVTGLWSLSLLHNDKHDNEDKLSAVRRMRVVEVDVPAIADAKKQAIQQMNSWHHPHRPDEEQAEGQHSRCCRSRIVWEGTHKKENCNGTYILATADLQDALAVDEIFTELLEPNRPTLVISELVLAYLQPESCDNLLRRCASFLGDGSCVVLYEPLGPSVDPPTRSDEKVDETYSSPESVLEAYRRSLDRQFNFKLQRGLACTKSDPKEHDSMSENSMKHFHPLGVSCANVAERLQRMGFPHACATTAGIAAASLRQLEWKAKELFDEHAALALHLSSYTVACGFPQHPCSTTTLTTASSPSFDGLLFRRIMCDWHKACGLFGPPKRIRLRKVDTTEDDKSGIWITSIERDDEQQVRNLFSETYSHLFEKYPAVRKMVKSALRKDLGGGDGGATRSLTTSTNDNVSTIGVRYGEFGGDFLVVVQNCTGEKCDGATNESHAVSDSKKADEQRLHIPCRRVLGGIGIRKCTKEERAARKMPFDATCYEIHRFFVDEKYRTRGVGSALLRAAVDMLSLRQSRRRNTPRKGNDPSQVQVVATAPTILESANHFYLAKGFDVISDAEVGDLTMRTYVKVLSVS